MSMTVLTHGNSLIFNFKRSFPVVKWCHSCILNYSTVITSPKNKYLLAIPRYNSDETLLKPLSSSNKSFVYQHNFLQTTSAKPTDVNLKSTKIITAKRPSRKRATSIIEDEESKRVQAYAVGEEISLDELQKALEVQGLYNAVQLPVDAVDALYVQAKYNVNGYGREIFFFREGSAVFWNLPTIERNEVIRFLQKHCEDPYDISLSLHESEQMEFQNSESGTSLSGDKINLSNSDKTDQILEKYACSNALTQSVKLAIWEASLEKFISSIEQVTEDLRDGKKIKMSRRDVLRKTGELFSLRHKINLNSDLLDTPDFYWNREILESLYQRVCNHLNIARRTRILNEKISHCCELTELLSSHLNDVHHVRLEWMIIILIMVEVVFETFHYMDRYYSTVDSERKT